MLECMGCIKAAFLNAVVWLRYWEYIKWNILMELVYKHGLARCFFFLIYFIFFYVSFRFCLFYLHINRHSNVCNECLVFGLYAV